MLRNHFRILSTLIRLVDLGFLFLALCLAQYLAPWLAQVLPGGEDPAWIQPSASGGLHLGGLHLGGLLMWQIAIVLALWGHFSWREGIYDSHRTEGPFSLALSVGQALFFALTLGSLLGLLVFGTLAFHPLLALFFAILLLPGARVLLQSVLHLARSQGFNFRQVLIVGRGPAARSFLEELNRNRGYGFRVIGALSFPDERERSETELEGAGGVTRRQVEDLGESERFQEIFADLEVDQVLISPSGGTRDEEVSVICRGCDTVGIPYLYSPGYLSENRVSTQPVWLGSVPSLSFHAGNRPTARLVIKRIMDIVGAGLGLLLLAPLFLVVAIVIKATDRGPVFFKQVRVGKGGRRFDCFKFRSMQCDAEETKELLLSRNESDGPTFKIRRDPRVTVMGRFLRKFSMDELPQLWNVLRGDMSLVGPRPPVPEEVLCYEWWQRRRLAVKPGLTCIWQVWGRNKVSFKRWVEMDIQYIEGWSLWLDAKLILHTFGVVFRGTGM
jgi:exopolysaccharide biosynthesis polyprenyl glycosylphosphotransferase